MKGGHKFHPVVILLTSLVISLSLVLFSSAQTYTPDFQVIIKQLQDQIKLLNQQILDLQSRVEKTEEEVEIVKAELKFTKSIKKGESNEEVKQLQEFLKQFPDIYPEGIVSGFFGSLTETAVKRFQEKHGIESVGIVGPKTIQKLNEFSVSASPAIPAIPAIPAVPATPAIPASPSQPLVSPTATPKRASPSFLPTPIAQPATPATPAQPATSSPIPTAIASPSFSPTSTPTPSPTLTPSGSPPVISNIQMSSTANSFTVKWTTDKPSDSLVKYYIDLTPYDTQSAIRYEGLYINSEKYDSAMVTNHLITIDNLSSGIEFRFQIFSKDNNGNISADPTYFLGWTLAASLTPTPAPILTPTPDTIPPSAPTGLSAAATSPSQINLSWNATTDNIGVTGYKIYRDGAIWWSIWDPAIRSFSDTGLSSNTSYSYYVTAFDAAGNGSPGSTTVSATTQSGTITCSGLNLTFTNNKTSYVKGESVNYTWVCAPGGTTSYVEIQVVKPDGTATMYNSSGGSTQTFGFSTENLTAGDYTLRACFSIGCSSVTASLQFTITGGTSTKTTSFFGSILKGFSEIFRR